MVVASCRSVAQHSFKQGSKMAAFLHCNACYFCAGMAVQRIFYITNCGHTYCANCVDAATKGHCKVCKSQCTFICLNGKIPKEVELLFKDPLETIQKAFKEAYQRIEFQRSHQKRLFRHLSQQVQHVGILIKQVQKLENEKQVLKKQNEYLERLLQKQSNPSLHRGNQRSGLFRASPGSTSPITVKQNQNGDKQPYNGGVNILPQHGRISMRSPPLGGFLGTSMDQSYPSPGENVCHDSSESLPTTPLTIPRPINFGRRT